MMIPVLLLLAALQTVVVDPILPNRHLTPGATLPVTTAQVCTPGYATKARHVTNRTKKQVFATYGLKPSGAYEVDHLISLQLGGSNDRVNLWPQSYETQPLNAHTKDALENRLHALVCRGTISLETAQTAIRADWVRAYRQYVQ